MEHVESRRSSIWDFVEYSLVELAGEQTIQRQAEPCC
jgi:hypothetical protein